MLGLFLSEDNFIGRKFGSIESMTAEEKSCISAIVTQIAVIITCANVANNMKLSPDLKDKSTSDASTLKKVDEDQEMNDEEFDDYEIDEQKLMDNVKHEKPLRERSVSAVAREEDEKTQNETKKQFQEVMDSGYSSLLRALTGEYGDKVLREIPYEHFINKTMTMLLSIVTKRDIADMDKLIVEKASYVMSLLFLFNEDLLQPFYNFKDPKTGMGLKEIVIKGITFTTDAEIKQLFSKLIVFVCRKIKQTTKVRLPIMVILEIMKEHFYESFKDEVRGYGYNEYYDMFSNLIHDYFSFQDSRNKRFEQIIEPKEFIAEIVTLLKKYKAKEKRNTMLEDHCLIGIFSILERLLRDKPEYIDYFALDHGLLNELFFNCLFQKAIEAPHLDVTAAFDPNSGKYPL